MKTSIIILLSLLVAPSYAFNKKLNHQYNLAYSNYIREKVQTLSEDQSVEIILKNGKVVKGTFDSFVAYDDTVWINPLGTQNIFKAVAFDINEIYDVVLVVSEPV